MFSLILTIIVFFTIALVVFFFGAAVVSPSSMLGARLRALGGQQQTAEAKPAFRERIEQAMHPLSKAIPLSSADVSRTRAWLIQAGYRDVMDVNYYFGARMLGVGLGFSAVALFAGFDNPF